MRHRCFVIPCTTVPSGQKEAEHLMSSATVLWMQMLLLTEAGKITDTILFPPWPRPCDGNPAMLRIPEHAEPRISVHRSFCCPLELTHVGAM